MWLSVWSTPVLRELLIFGSLPFSSSLPVQSGRNARDWGMGTTESPEVYLIILTPLLPPAWGKQKSATAPQLMFSMYYRHVKDASLLLFPCPSVQDATQYVKQRDMYTYWNFEPRLNATIWEKTGLLETTCQKTRYLLLTLTFTMYQRVEAPSRCLSQIPCISC